MSFAVVNSAEPNKRTEKEVIDDNSTWTTCYRFRNHRFRFDIKNSQGVEDKSAVLGVIRVRKIAMQTLHREDVSATIETHQLTRSEGGAAAADYGRVCLISVIFIRRTRAVYTRTQSTGGKTWTIITRNPTGVVGLADGLVYFRAATDAVCLAGGPAA